MLVVFRTSRTALGVPRWQFGMFVHDVVMWRQGGLRRCLVSIPAQLFRRQVSSVSPARGAQVGRLLPPLQDSY